MTKLRILYLSNYFPPEVGAGPYYPMELCESLVRGGHDVTMVTGFPRYNVPAMPLQYRRRLLYREDMGGVKVLRVNAPNLYGKTMLSRGLTQLLAPPVLALRALPLDPPDLVYTGSPPLLLGVAANLVATRFRVPCVVNVQDLFPQTVIDLGMLRNRAVIRFFEAMERYIYRTAAAITVMSEGNRRHILARGGDARKVHVVANWVDTHLIRPGERLNDFRRAHGLGDEFIVLFAGTMGFFQGLDTVIDAARLLADRPGILFLMVGSGAERERLQQRAAGLANVRFLPMQPKEVYPQVLAASDTCLVTLHPQTTTPVIPSKIGTIMAAGRPVLGSLPPGDAPRLVADARCGIVVPAGNSQALASAILTLRCDPEATRRMGKNGRKYAEDHLSRCVCIDQIEHIFQQVSTTRRSRPTHGT
jgi:glycosyltransferase involved in cell wall biosynthesis